MNSKIFQKVHNILRFLMKLSSVTCQTSSSSISKSTITTPPIFTNFHISYININMPHQKHFKNNHIHNLIFISKIMTRKMKNLYIKKQNIHTVHKHLKIYHIMIIYYPHFQKYQ